MVGEAAAPGHSGVRRGAVRQRVVALAINIALRREADGQPTEWRHRAEIGFPRDEPSHATIDVARSPTIWV